MKFNHWTQKPEIADLDCCGSVSLIYIYRTSFHVMSIKGSHEYFIDGDSWRKTYPGITILGWIPGNGSFSFSDWHKSIEAPENKLVSQSFPEPKNEKRRIRIIEINDEK